MNLNIRIIIALTAYQNVLYSANAKHRKNPCPVTSVLLIKPKLKSNENSLIYELFNKHVKENAAVY